jgi:hypothetical protein
MCQTPNFLLKIRQVISKFYAVYQISKIISFLIINIFSILLCFKIFEKLTYSFFSVTIKFEKGSHTVRNVFRELFVCTMTYMNANIFLHLNEFITKLLHFVTIKSYFMSKLNILRSQKQAHITR